MDMAHIIIQYRIKQSIFQCAATAGVKSKCAAEKSNVCGKMRRDSGQNGDLCADYQVLGSFKSCLKYTLDRSRQPYINSTIQLHLKVLSFEMVESA